MTVSDLIFRLLEFNSEDEIRICGGFPLDSTDIRVSDTPNVVMLGSGIRGLKEIINNLTDCSNNLERMVDNFNFEYRDTDDYLYDTDDLELEISNLNDVINELVDLSEV